MICGHVIRMTATTYQGADRRDGFDKGVCATEWADRLGKITIGTKDDIPVDRIANLHKSHVLMASHRLLNIAGVHDASRAI
jgi:hypothetical protein